MSPSIPSKESPRSSGIDRAGGAARSDARPWPAEPRRAAGASAAALLRDGASAEPGALLPGVVEGYRLRCRPVDAGWHRPLFGTAVGFYRRTPVPFVFFGGPAEKADTPCT